MGLLLELIIVKWVAILDTLVQIILVLPAIKGAQSVNLLLAIAMSA